MQIKRLWNTPHTKLVTNICFALEMLGTVCVRESSKVHRSCNVTPEWRRFSWEASQPEGTVEKGMMSFLAEPCGTLVRNSVCVVILSVHFSSWFGPRRCPPPQSAQRMLACTTLMSGGVHVGNVLSLLTLYSPNARASGLNSLEEVLQYEWNLLHRDKIWLITLPDDQNGGENSVTMSSRASPVSAQDFMIKIPAVVFPNKDLELP